MVGARAGPAWLLPHGASRHTLIRKGCSILVFLHEAFYYTYIVASKSRTLYIGVTRDLHKRVFEHKQKIHEGFSAKYNCNRLVWFDRFLDVRNAIHREKELKGWLRARKVSMIEIANPTWEDLSAEWYPHLKGR